MTLDLDPKGTVRFHATSEDRGRIVTAEGGWRFISEVNDAVIESTYTVLDAGTLAVASAGGRGPTANMRWKKR